MMLLLDVTELSTHNTEQSKYRSGNLIANFEHIHRIISIVNFKNAIVYYGYDTMVINLVTLMASLNILLPHTNQVQG